MEKTTERLKVKEGSFLVPGVTRIDNGYNFTIEADRKASVSLLLYHKNSTEPVKEIEFTDEMRRGRVRSIRLEGLSPSMYEYNYKINGQICHDPAAKLIHGREVFGVPAQKSDHGIRCRLLGKDSFDWEGDSFPEIRYSDLILYKLHVRGFTKALPGRKKTHGTFAGLKEMIPYLKDLGVNAVELMPAYEFEETIAASEDKAMVKDIVDTEKINYWGYVSGYYFAPKKSYCAGTNPENEVRDMVKALHKSGIECIMEFFFPNGTDASYALAALHWWKIFYHVDGFHILGEDSLIDLVLRDGLLADTKIMVDHYDFNSLHHAQLSDRKNLAEYNMGFQRSMRRFMKSDEDMVGAAIAGTRNNYENHAVINYMTSQDGFTLNDLVSYTYRHNEANGENNADGSGYNYSWNCGAEGRTRKLSVKKMREKQIRNAIMLMMLSQGTPMIYGGDEIGNSQEGNNNAWCQDNEIGWINWKQRKRNSALLDFVKNAVGFRKEHPILHMDQPLRGTDYKGIGFPDMSIHGEKAWYINYDNTSRMFGVMYNEGYARNRQDRKEYTSRDFLYVAYNFHWEERSFAIPSLPAGIQWKKAVDTSKPFAEAFEQESMDYEKMISVSPRSIVVLVGEEAGE